MNYTVRTVEVCEISVDARDEQEALIIAENALVNDETAMVTNHQLSFAVLDGKKTNYYKQD